jgi:hypothetical protein
MFVEFFIKYGDKIHLQQLLEGKIRFTSLRRYTRIEDQEAYFYDKDEGILGLHDSANITILLGPPDNPVITLSAKNGLIGSVAVRPYADDLPHALCMSFISIPLNQKIQEKMAKGSCLADLVSNGDMKDFGESVFVVRDLEEFIKRIERAAAKENADVRAGLVKYTDMSKVSRNFTPSEIGFIKDIRYAKEKEIRIIMTSKENHPKNEIWTIDVGSLTDICLIVPAEELFKQKASLR